MKRIARKIDHIPTILWGPYTGRLLVAVHGNQSHKEDTVLVMLAEVAVERGYQMLSFDLPEHGERKNEKIACHVENCVKELHAIMDYAKTMAEEISLFGCSLGAYFSLLAFREERFKQALFLSPVVDMQRMIENMMSWFSVSEQQLKSQGEIDTPAGQPLRWDYYQYVKAHPINQWATPTRILYGAADALCERDVVECFAKHFDCKLTVQEQGEHFFHTPQQLDCYRAWLRQNLQ